MHPPLSILWGKLPWVRDPFNYLLSRAAPKSIIFSPFLFPFPHLLPVSLSLIPFFPLPVLASSSSLSIWSFPFISLFPLPTFPDNTQPLLGPESWWPTIAAANWLQLIPGDTERSLSQQFANGTKGHSAPTMAQLSAHCISPACLFNWFTWQRCKVNCTPLNWSDLGNNLLFPNPLPLFSQSFQETSQRTRLRDEEWLLISLPGLEDSMVSLPLPPSPKQTQSPHHFCGLRKLYTN